jgi:hypothetical protein
MAQKRIEMLHGVQKKPCFYKFIKIDRQEHRQEKTEIVV